jgi:hypothetical protein
MQTLLHHHQGHLIVEIVADGVIIHNAQDLLDLMMNLPDPVTQKIILHRHHFAPEFFDLSTGLAGEALQKVVNYGRQLAIVGDFPNAGESLRAFIMESNRGRHFFLVPDIAAAKETFS